MVQFTIGRACNEDCCCITHYIDWRNRTVLCRPERQLASTQTGSSSIRLRAARSHRDMENLFDKPELVDLTDKAVQYLNMFWNPFRCMQIGRPCMLPVVLCNKYENHKFMESYKCDLHGLKKLPQTCISPAMFFGASLEITRYSIIRNARSCWVKIGGLRWRWGPDQPEAYAMEQDFGIFWVTLG